MPNPNFGPGEGAAAAISAASAKLFVERVSQPLTALPDPERSQEIARILGGHVNYLLATSPTFAKGPVHNPIVIRVGVEGVA